MSDKNDIVCIELKWLYTPEKLLEGEFKKDLEGVELAIKNGVIKAEISPKKIGNDGALTQKLTAFIRSRFQAA